MCAVCDGGCGKMYKEGQHKMYECGECNISFCAECISPEKNRGRFPLRDAYTFVGGEYPTEGKLSETKEDVVGTTNTAASNTAASVTAASVTAASVTTATDIAESTTAGNTSVENTLPLGYSCTIH